jgi:hypothetical protein
MLKFRYLLIVFLFNFFLKSAYPQSSCTANSNNTGDCTGPLNITSTVPTVTNSGTITSTITASNTFAYGIYDSSSLGGNIISNTNSISVTSIYVSYGIHNLSTNEQVTNSGTINVVGVNSSFAYTSSKANNKFTNTSTGTITVTSGVAYGIYGYTGSSDLTVANAGTISSITGVGGYSAPAIVSNDSNFKLTNSGTISATSAGSNEAIGITSTGSGAIITNANTGVITATSTNFLGYAINNSGSNLTFSNSGTVSGTSTSSFGYAINNNGSNLKFSNSGTLSGTSTSSFAVGFRDRVGGEITNSGTISGTSTSGAGYGLYLTGNNATITNSSTGTITGSTASIINTGTGITITNSGTITGGTDSINNSGVINLTLNQGSKLIGTITNSGTLNITSNVGAAKSYAYSGTVTSLTDSNNRPSALGSAVAINIGSMEVSGENLYQKTANITDAIDRNVKNNKDTWVEPYYSESTRDSGGDSSQIRQFKNNKQGINAGFKVENSAPPLQVIFNVDQTKNNIDSSEHIINSDGVMIGLMAPKYTQYEGFDVSVKGLVGYANSKTNRKILDNTSSTGERTLTGEYDSYYAVVGSALSKNYNLDKDLNANLTLGVDLTSEFRDSYSENLYFKYSSLDLVQLQPRIQSEFIKTTGKDSNVFLTAGVGAREVLSGKTQKYSMNNTGVSFTTPNSGDYYASLAAGTNMNVAANVNFYALVSAKMSEKDTETYQASIGLKGTF